MGLLERVIGVKMGMPSVPSTPALVAQSHHCLWPLSVFLYICVAPIDPHSVAPISTGMTYNPVDINTIRPNNIHHHSIYRSPNGRNPTDEGYILGFFLTSCIA